MKFTTADLPKIRISLIAALLMMALGTATLFYSLERDTAAQAAKNSAERSFKEFDGKLKQVRHEESEIRQKIATFHQLQARGIIGEEPRLEWIELLKSIKEQRHLIGMDYEIAGPHLLIPLDAHLERGGDLTFYASTMKLHLKLLHEEDLTRLLADLRRQAKALIQVKSCKISRLENGSPEGASRRAALSAECEIDWITLHGAVRP